MARQRAPSDLRGRREDLGATARQMAAGLGIGPDAVVAAESGAGGNDHRALYTAWLSRLEALTAGQRTLQLERASAGERFE